MHDRSPGRRTPPAQNSLGVRSANGQGVQQDYNAAAPWFGKAAKQGYADAQSKLGGMHIKGEGVKQDCTEEYSGWFRKSAELGNAVAQSNLGAIVC